MKKSAFLFFWACCAVNINCLGAIDSNNTTNKAFTADDNDMSWALGLYGSSEPGIVQGWYDKCYFGNRSTFSDFIQNEWEKLGEGESLYQAIMYGIEKCEMDPQFLEYPCENYRLTGTGGQNINELVIR